MGLFSKFQKNDSIKNFDTSGQLTEDELEQITSINIQDFSDYMSENEVINIMKNHKDNYMDIITTIVQERKRNNLLDEFYNSKKTK